MSAIGVFDSGVGGLSVLKQLHNTFPYQKFIYLADTLNMPYGDKDHDSLNIILKKNLSFFEDINDIKAIVIACNTMSCFLPFPNSIPIIGIIDSLIDSLNIYNKDISKIGILATYFTVQKQIYLKKIKENYPFLPIVQVAAPMLVPSIEQNAPDLEKTLQQYLNDFPKDTSHLILGCTHYNLLLKEFQESFRDFTIIDPYKEIIAKLQTIISPKDNQIKDIQYFTTKYSENLKINSEKIMLQEINWHQILL